MRWMVCAGFNGVVAMLNGAAFIIQPSIANLALMLFSFALAAFSLVMAERAR